MTSKKSAKYAMILAYSYLRFSSPEQAKGDSFRRQIELRDAWIARNGVTLDTTLSLKDEGVSGFRGKNREDDRHALAQFLKLVEQGKIAKGSYLIVESLDRLSREHIRPALTLLLRLIEAGIRVVQLLPTECIYDDGVEPMTLMMGIMELSRGHSESKMKSERVGRAWQEKKKNAMREGEILTKRAPSWLTVKDGKFQVDEVKAETVRKLYALATSGVGIGVIVKRFNDEGVAPIGDGDHWARSSVAKLLGNRAVIGEYQPFTGRGARRVAEGKPIPGYYPSILTEDKFHAAQAAKGSRRLTGGKPLSDDAASAVNLFQGLLHDARDGGTIHAVNKGVGNKGGLLLIPYNGQLGVHGSVSASFPAPVFEKAILSRLQEINPLEVLPDQNETPLAERFLALTGKLAGIDSRIEGVKSKLMDDGDELVSLVDVLRRLEGQRLKITEELEQVRRENATPLNTAWRDTQTLLEALDVAPDPEEARTRLKACLRRIVDGGIFCVFVPRGQIRIAAVQIRFSGGLHRDYLILHRKAHANANATREATTLVRSFSREGAGPVDFSNRKHAAKLVKELEEMPLEGIFEAEEE